MQYFLMQRLLLDEKDEELLCGAAVGVAGIGGIGSPAVEVLVRNGIPALRIADVDCFEASNCRQLYQTNDTLGVPKVDVARLRILEINPRADVRTFGDGVNPGNYLEFCDGVDAVCSQSDDISSILLVHLGAAKCRVPVYKAARMNPVNRYVLGVKQWDYRELELDHTGLVAEYSRTWGVPARLLGELIAHAEKGEDCPALRSQIYDLNQEHRRRIFREAVIDGKTANITHLPKDYIERIIDEYPGTCYKMAITPELCMMMGALVASAIKDSILKRPFNPVQIDLRNYRLASGEDKRPGIPAYSGVVKEPS